MEEDLLSLKVAALTVRLNERSFTFDYNMEDE